VNLDLPIDVLHRLDDHAASRLKTWQSLIEAWLYDKLKEEDN